MTNFDVHYDVISQIQNALRHIRYIHYSLVISCIIIVIASERLDTYYHRAINQLNDAIAIINNFKRGWFNEYMYNNFPSVQIDYNYYQSIGGFIYYVSFPEESDKKQNESTNYNYDLKDNLIEPIDIISEENSLTITDVRPIYVPKWFAESKGQIVINPVTDNSLLFLESRGVSIFDKRFNLEEPLSLEKVLSFFEFITNISGLYIVSKDPVIGVLGNDNDKIEFLKITKTIFPTSGELIERITNDKPALPVLRIKNYSMNSNSIYFLDYKYVANFHKYEQFTDYQNLNVKIDTIKVDHEQVINRFLSESVNSNNFKIKNIVNHFKELNELPYYFRSMDLAQLEEYLDDMKNTMTADVNLLGITVPRTNLSVWGILLIISLQLYLLLHLHSITENYSLPVTEKCPIFPSILCYSENPIAILCTYLTISIMPTISVIDSSRKSVVYHDEFSLMWSFYLILIFISIIISKFSFNKLSKWFSLIRREKYSLLNEFINIKVIVEKFLQNHVK